MSVWYISQKMVSAFGPVLYEPKVIATNYGLRMQVKKKKSKKDTGQNSLPYLHIKFETSTSPYTKLISWLWRGFLPLLIWWSDISEVSTAAQLQVRWLSDTESLFLLAWFPPAHQHTFQAQAEGWSAKEFRKIVHTLLKWWNHGMG